MAVERAHYSVEISEQPFEVRDYAPAIVASVQVDGAREDAVNAGFRILAGYIFGDNQTQGKIAMTAPVTQSESAGQRIAMTAPVTQSESAGQRIAMTAPVTQSESAGQRIAMTAPVTQSESAGQRIAMTAPVTQGESAGQRIAMTAPVTQSESAGRKLAMTAPVEQNRAQNGWEIRFTMPAAYTMSTLPKPRDARVHLVEIPARRTAAITFSGFWSDSNLLSHRAQLLEFLISHHLTAISAPVYAFYDPPWTPWFWRTNEVLVDVASSAP